ncbi:MAG TPA: hypothetical protein VF380_08140 [Solirubrobacteraceae bacterium]
MARILIVAGGCRGRQLAAAMAREGHAVRVTTRTEAGRAAIEAAGAECWIGTPDRLATLRGSLDNVTVLCWLMGTAVGSEEELAALHGTRLEFFLTQAIDTTVRGFVYEEAGAGRSRELLLEGARRARVLLERNAIPAAFLDADPADAEAWPAQARAAVGALLAPA